MSLIINPGTGPVASATRENAEANMRVLLEDAGATNAEVRFVKPGVIYGTDKPDGRFEFVATLDGHECEVEMPGLPVERVRYLGRDHGQNIWDFPRLYVDGSSWVWSFAVGFVHDALHGVEEEDEETFYGDEEAGVGA